MTKLDWVERELAKRPPRSEAWKADDEPATLGANTDQEADGRNLIREMAKIEWGVAYERGGDHGLRERAGRTAAPGCFRR